ncbi:sensor domain-containing diguanylate cyclase [Agaribacterium haliotis]|uniref:sensor domain-containing diguanylate cyclase n=1 Tax=Agaribacterium haliotis TaxID=2013869 RepID=UPI000BB59800|nr:sensor domain-containing diguanylate cyclase [Agaribacterium haliotis]
MTLFSPSSSPSRRSIFLFPFVGVLAFTLIASASLELILRHWYADRTDKDMRQLMATTIDTLRRIGTDDYEIAVAVDSLGLAAPKYRLTISTADGRIIADSVLSEEGLEPGDSLAKSKEYLALQHSNEVRLSRYSAAADGEMLFLIKRFQVDNFKGLIRIGMQTAEFNGAIFELRLLLGGLALVALLSMAGLVSMFSRYINALMSREQSFLESRVEQRTRDILLLHRLTNMLAACQNLTEVQNVVEDIVPRIIGNTNCSVSLVNASRNLVEKKIDWGGEWPGDDIFNPDDCWALRKGKLHFSHDELSAQSCPHMGQCEQTTLCIPLLAHGNAIGLLHMMPGKDTSARIQDMTMTIAEHLGLALANLDMQERLRQQATRDALTGLYNRRHFEESLDKELSRSQRHHEPCGLLMIDIDHFKSFNDTFGHDAGDYVLKSLSLLLKDAVRNEDTVCRLGGEEIAVILPKANINDAIACADKLCRVIAGNHFQLNSTALGSVTISIGLSIYPIHAHSSEGLIKSADIALYDAKANGRNRFEVASISEDGEQGYCLVEPYNETDNNSNDRKMA